MSDPGYLPFSKKWMIASAGIFIVVSTGQTYSIFPTTLSPKRAPARARKKATPPPINILVRLKWMNLYGVKNETNNMSATERNAPTAGSLVRTPGEIRPIMKPPMKKLTRLSKPCIRNRKLIDMNLPTTTSPISPPRNSSKVSPRTLVIMDNERFEGWQPSESRIQAGKENMKKRGKLSGDQQDN